MSTCLVEPNRTDLQYGIRGPTRLREGLKRERKGEEGIMKRRV